MAKEETIPTTIFGKEDQLNAILHCISDLAFFRPNISYQSQVYQKNSTQENYENFINQVDPLIEMLDLTVPSTLTHNQHIEDTEVIASFFQQYYRSYKNIASQIVEIEEQNKDFRHLLLQLSKMQDLDLDIELLFSLSFLKIRFGKMPKKSYENLSNFQDELLLFFPMKLDKQDCWGFYFTTEEEADFIDNTLLSMGFTRIRIPNYIHGTGSFMIEYIQKVIQLEENRVVQLQEDLKKLDDKNMDLALAYHEDYLFLKKVQHVKSLVWRKDRDFMIKGFIPHHKKLELEQKLNTIAHIKLVYI